MSDQRSIRDIAERYTNLKSFKEFLPNTLPGAAENVATEIYNWNDETITFESFHPERHRMHFFNLPPTHWNRIECKPGEWVFLPHTMYIGSVPSGRPIKVTANRGDQMFIGNKLPSRPEGKKINIFQTKK